MCLKFERIVIVTVLDAFVVRWTGIEGLSGLNVPKCVIGN
jgi:hypothetical protein